MNNYRINEFAKRVGRSVQTIRRWEREGKLTAKRLPSGHRYFDESDVRLLMGGAPDKKDVVVYCRVSSSGQKDDLASQVAAMQTYCLAGAIPVDHCCEIVVVNQESLSPQQEMVEDLMAIVHTFSCRLYGMRKYKTTINSDFPQYKLQVPKDELQ